MNVSLLSITEVFNEKADDATAYAYYSMLRKWASQAVATCQDNRSGAEACWIREQLGVNITRNMLQVTMRYYEDCIIARQHAIPNHLLRTRF